MISFFFAVALQRAFNSIYVSLWCHWSVSRYQFRYCNWTEAKRKLIYFPQLLILISLSILFMLCHGPLHFEISVIVSSLTIASGKKINTETSSARRCCLWCSSTFNETDGKIIWWSKDTENSRSSLLPATFLCAEWKWHMQVKTMKAVINDSETLITLDFYAFYSKTRTGKSSEFSIIFLFFLQAKQKDFLCLIFSELVLLSSTAIMADC